MVSGLVTSPEDQSRICLLEASPIRIASNSLMSIKSLLALLVFEFQIHEAGVAERSNLGLALLLGLLALRYLDVVEVAERLVGRQGQNAGLVGAPPAPPPLPGGRLAADGPQRAGREVDAELLGRAQELVLLLA